MFCISKIYNLDKHVVVLKYKIKELSESNNKNERWVRRSNIQINGARHRRGENLVQIINSIAKKGGWKLNFDADIDFVTRVAIKNDTTDNKPRPIAVKFQAVYK